MDRLQYKCNNSEDLITCFGLAVKTQLGLTFCVLLLSGCSESGKGRFLPTSPSAPNVALDSKTAQRCRLQGGATAAIKKENDLQASKLEERSADMAKDYPDLAKGYADLAKQTRETEVLPLCSEIIATEEKSKETIATFLGFLFALTFGIYMTIRHWRREQNP